MKRSYVMIEGQLREKVGDNHAIINGENWYCISGTWAPAGSSPSSAPMIMPDIAPYRSVIDGSEITSRSRHREHLRAHGCIEIGNEKPRPPQTEWTATKGLRQELIGRLNN